MCLRFSMQAASISRPYNRTYAGYLTDAEIGVPG